MLENFRANVLKEILAKKHSFFKSLQRFQVDNSFLGFCFYYLRISKFPRAQCLFLKARREILTSLGGGTFLKCSIEWVYLLYTPYWHFGSRSVEKMDGGQIVSGNKQRKKVKKSKTKEILQETQYEKETLLLAIGYKRFELSIFTYLIYMSSRPIFW